MLIVNQISLTNLRAESSSSKQEEWAKETMNLALFILPKSFLHAVKSYNMGPLAILPSEGRLAAEFVAVASTGFEHANLGSRGKHANHYTTEVTTCDVRTQIYCNKQLLTVSVV
jgi:hypothetical protein